MWSEAADMVGQWAADSVARRLIIATLIGALVAIALNLFVSRIVLRAVKLVAQRVDNTDDAEKLLRWRRLETSLSVVLATTKIVMTLLAFYVAWHIFSPRSAPVAVIGAGAVFAVIASATAGPLLRDFTYGIIMIAERWYNVGDIVAIEPFSKITGVVEQVTLRATKIRSISGEVIWIHNQHIQGVRITPRGARTLAVEVFVSNLAAGKKLVEEALAAVPAGPTTVIKPFKIVETEELSPKLWRIKAQGQTAPGREWLIENFAVAAIKEQDTLLHGEPGVVIHGPIVLFADDTAERRFKRSVRVSKTALAP